MINRRIGALLTCFALLFVLSTNTTLAQSTTHKVKTENWSLGLHLGIPYTNFDVGTVVTPLYGLDLNYRLSPVFSMQLNANVGDFKSNHRVTWFGRTFKNNFYQLTLQPHLNLTRLLNGNVPQRYYMYAFAGIGFIHNNVTTGVNPQLAKSHNPIPAPFQGRDLHKPGMMFPVGLEMRYFVSNNVSLDFGAQYNLTTADNLDGYERVPSNYVSDKNNKLKDKSFYFTAGVSFNIGQLFGGHNSSSNSAGYNNASTGLINFYHSTPTVHIDTTITKQKLTRLTLSKNELANTNQKVDSLENVLSMNKSNYSNHSQALQNRIESLQAKVDTLKNQQKNWASGNARDYVIDGAFYNESRAHNFAKQLKAKGYINTHVIYQDKTWYLVSVGQYKNEELALQKMKDLRKSLNSKIWVYIDK